MIQAMRKGMKESQAVEQSVPQQKNTKKELDTSGEKKERCKNICTVSSRMRQVVDQMLGCDEEAYRAALHHTTIFAFKSQQSEIISSFLQDIRHENMQMYQNKDLLLQSISDAYDEAQCLVGTPAP